jgi:ABC-type multidrug transport system ATPase subunit
VIFAYIFQTMIARQLWKSEIKRRAISDIKFQKIIELVESIRHLRWYAWEDVWLARVLEARKNELNLRIITSLWNILMTFINTFASGMFPVVAFYAYTVWAGLPLRVDIAFPALQLFSMLETNLRAVPRIITILLNTSISFKRMDAFMSEPDKAEGDDRLASTEIEMKNASFAWPGATEPVLNNITVSFPPGLTMLCGEVGAGKTALLQAMCGELHLLAGEYYRSSEMVGYCQQTPWLQSMSIRENILFFCPYEEDRYNQILEACALVPDLANFKDGDLSMIGENGVGLSGGQKSRVALARAVYSNARLLFLDDPLSALDHQTAEMIVEKCLVGPLMKGRTVILVTHRTELCMGRSQQVVQISNGRAKVMDPKSSPAFVDLHDPKAAEEEALAEIEAREPAAKPSAFITTEHREHGDVKLRVYWEYIKAGKLKWWFVLICLLGLTRLVEVSETWFLKLWGEAYGNSEGFEGSILRSRFTAIKSYLVTRAFSTDAFWKSQTITQDIVAVTATNSSTGGLSSGLLGNWPSPEDDIHPWLVGFFVLAAAQSMAYLISRAFMIVIVYVAGKSMFERAMTKITHSTFRM